MSLWLAKSQIEVRDCGRGGGSRDATTQKGNGDGGDAGGSRGRGERIEASAVRCGTARKQL